MSPARAISWTILAARTKPRALPPQAAGIVLHTGRGNDPGVRMAQGTGIAQPNASAGS